MLLALVYPSVRIDQKFTIGSADDGSHCWDVQVSPDALSSCNHIATTSTML